MKSNIDIIIEILKVETKKFKQPVVAVISKEKKTPYRILISTLLSLRTKDEVTLKASRKLFLLAETPENMIKLSPEEIERAIYPVGFYHRKAIQIIEISKVLVENYQSIVPDTIDELLKFKGVGRKTANLVITEGFGKKGITVDTHVHRISNRLGLVKTKNPDQTEFELMKVLPEKHWIIYNDLLVVWGQNICNPVSPKCSICAISSYCKKVNVAKSR